VSNKKKIARLDNAKWKRVALVLWLTSSAASILAKLTEE